MTFLPKDTPVAVVFPDDAALLLGPNRITILRDSWCAGGGDRQFRNNGCGMVALDVAPYFAASQTLHWHTREDWTGTVLDGRIELRFADRREMIPRGGTVVVPARCPFTWANPDASPARLVCTYSPGGFENYYREAAALLAAADCRDSAKLLPLREKYGLLSES